VQKMKRKKKKGPIHEKIEILRSVFEPTVLAKSYLKGVVSIIVLCAINVCDCLYFVFVSQTKTLDHGPPMTSAEFESYV
jgi:hypothetical protein